MKTFFAVTAALLVAASSAEASGPTRVKLHFQGFGCEPIIDVYLQSRIAQAVEEADGCGSSHHYYGVGERARVKAMGPAVVLGIADSDATGVAYEMTLQYPFVTGGTVWLDESEGQASSSGMTGYYTVLQ